MKTSTWLIIIGILLLFVPIPPFGFIFGAIAICLGLVLKLFTDV